MTNTLGMPIWATIFSLAVATGIYHSMDSFQVLVNYFLWVLVTAKMCDRMMIFGSWSCVFCGKCDAGYISKAIFSACDHSLGNQS